MANDSSFTVSDGTKILNDSLIFISKVTNDQIKVKPNEIKKIKYSGTDMSNITAYILLKDGRTVRGENVSLLSDSSINALVTNKVYKVIPLNDVKSVSNKNHWLGLPQGFLGGTLGGFAIGYLIVHLSDIARTGTDNQAFYTGFGITALGILGGSIIGWINGYTYTYQFNP